MKKPVLVIGIIMLMMTLYSASAQQKVIIDFADTDYQENVRLIKIQRNSDDVIFSYKDAQLVLEIGVIYNGGYMSMAEAFAAVPQLEYDVLLKNETFGKKYSFNITNIPSNIAENFESLTLTYKDHTGFSLSKLIVEDTELRFNDNIKLRFDDVITAGMEYKINKAERRIYINNLTIENGVLYVDPAVIYSPDSTVCTDYICNGVKQYGTEGVVLDVNSTWKRDLIMYLPFDDTSSTGTIYDMSENQIDGTPNPSANYIGYNTSVKYSGSASYYLNGSSDGSDRVDISDLQAFNSTFEDNFTILFNAYFIRDNDGFIFASDNADVSVSSDGTAIEYAWNGDGSDGNLATGTTQIGLNTWSYSGVQNNRSAGDRCVLLNGEKDYCVSYTGILLDRDFESKSADPILLGVRGNGLSNPVSIFIDNFMIYNRTLTTNEMDDIFQKGIRNNNGNLTINHTFASSGNSVNVSFTSSSTDSQSSICFKVEQETNSQLRCENTTEIFLSDSFSEVNITYIFNTTNSTKTPTLLSSTVELFQGNNKPEVVSGSESVILNNLLDGQENYTVSYNITDANGDNTISACFITHSSGQNSCSYTAYSPDVDIIGTQVENSTQFWTTSTKEPVLIMDFNVNLSNNNVYDLSGKGNNGTNEGAVFNSTGGYDGSGAYEFYKNSESIDSTDIDLQNLTISAWIYTHGSTDEQAIVSKFQGSNPVDREWLFRVETSNRLSFFTRDNSTQGQIQSTNTISLDSWHHVAVSFNYSNLSVSFYIDGVKQSNIESSPSTQFHNEDEIITIGSWQSGVNDNFNGSLDDVRIYNYVLSPDQIKMLYENKSHILNSSQTSDSGEEWTLHTVTHNTASYQGETTESYNITQGGYVCSCDFSIDQGASVSFVAQVNDTNNLIGSGTNYSGVSIDYDYFPDTTKTNSLTTQNYKVHYNLTSYIGNFTNISFQGASGESTKTVNLTNNTLVQDNSTEYSNDFINEDSSFTISGSEFVADTAYNIVRQLYYNNTLSKTLPRIELTIFLANYSASALAEKQDGVSWPDLSGNYYNGNFSFNISAQNASTNQLYRYSYDAKLAQFIGDSTADFVEEGSQKHWTYDGDYVLNFDLIGKTVKKTIQKTSLPEYLSKEGNYTKTFTNSTGKDYNDTFVENADDFEHSFDPPAGTYSFLLEYFTPIGSSGSPGGGGGGGSTEIIEVEVPVESNASILNGTIDFAGLDIYSITLFSLPKRTYKEFLITCEGGICQGDLNISENLLDYVDDYGVCDLESTACSRYVDMKDGEKKILFVSGLWPLAFAEVLEQNDNAYIGQISVQSQYDAQNWGVVVQGGGFFQTAYKMSKSDLGQRLGLSMPTAAFILFGTFVVLLLVAAVGIITAL